MSGLTGRQVAGVVGGVAALSIVFFLATGESSEDIQRKPELVDLMMNQSVQTCVIQDDPMDAAQYSDRLEYVLDHTRAKTLDYLLANKISVCLDKRLDDQKGGFFDREIHGVYYPDQHVVSLRDNGNDPAHTGIFGFSAGSYGPRFLNELKDNFGGMLDKYDNIDEVVSPLVAYRYTTSCGKSCTSTHYDWGSDSSGIRAPHALERNPELINPPTQNAPPAFNVS